MKLSAPQLVSLQWSPLIPNPTPHSAPQSSHAAPSNSLWCDVIAPPPGGATPTYGRSHRRGDKDVAPGSFLARSLPQQFKGAAAKPKAWGAHRSLWSLSRFCPPNLVVVTVHPFDRSPFRPPSFSRRHSSTPTKNTLDFKDEHEAGQSTGPSNPASKHSIDWPACCIDCLRSAPMPYSYE